MKLNKNMIINKITKKSERNKQKGWKGNKIKENYDNFFSNMKKMNEICFYLLVFQRMISLI